MDEFTEVYYIAFSHDLTVSGVWRFTAIGVVSS